MSGRNRSTIKLTPQQASLLHRTFGNNSPLCHECGGVGHKKKHCPSLANRGHCSYLFHPCCADPRRVCLRCDGFGHSWEECITPFEAIFTYEEGQNVGLYTAISTHVLAQMGQHKIYSFFGDCELSRVREPSTTSTRPSPKQQHQMRKAT